MKTSICAIIKNEHLFLDEWITWHLSLGFCAIHLFEDKDSKSHEDIVKKYENVYLRRYEDDKQVREILRHQGTAHRQTVLYQWFGDTYNNIYDWVAFIDLDEFIIFYNDYNLNKFVNEYQDYPAVLINWKMMGASGHIKHPTCDVMEAYTEVVDYEYFLTNPYKCICNLSKWDGMISHHLAKGYVTINLDDNLYNNNFTKISLNHYFTKSWEDWCDRIFNRGATQNCHRRIEDFFTLNKNMLKYKKELMESVSDKKPFGSYIPVEEQVVVNVGNIRKITSIKRLNSEYENESKYSNGKVKPVFDLGFHNGDTSLYYLNNGYTVIGVECNQNLVKSNLNTYNNFISDGKLVIVDKCISDKDNEIIPFYISKQSIWSSCNKNISERIDKSTTVDVETITLKKLIEVYGCPIYCKIDIEGNDVLAIRSLKGLQEIPQYISVEAECLGKGETVSDISMIDELKNVGYNKFMIIDQRKYRSFIFDFKYQYNWLTYDESKLQIDDLRKLEWDYGLWVDIFACK